MKSKLLKTLKNIVKGVHLHEAGHLLMILLERRRLKFKEPLTWAVYWCPGEGGYTASNFLEYLAENPKQHKDTIKRIALAGKRFASIISIATTTALLIVESLLVVIHGKVLLPILLILAIAVAILPAVTQLYEYRIQENLKDSDHYIYLHPEEYKFDYSRLYNPGWKKEKHGNWELPALNDEGEDVA